MKRISVFFVKICIFIVRGYQYVLSPLLGKNCRYLPTCSEYSIVAFKRHGVMRGGFLTIKRLLRCHPWAKHGHDPVP